MARLAKRDMIVELSKEFLVALVRAQVIDNGSRGSAGVASRIDREEACAVRLPLASPLHVIAGFFAVKGSSGRRSSRFVGSNRHDVSVRVDFRRGQQLASL